MTGRTLFLLTGLLLVASLFGTVTAIAGGVPDLSTPRSFAQAAKLTDQFGTADEGFGVSPAVSTDGSTIAVGAPGANGNKGAVFVYVLQSGVWVQTATLTLPSEPSGFLLFGGVVAISADGSTIATNEVVTGSDGGSYVEVFTRTGGGWGSESDPAQIAQPPDPTTLNDTFGNALAVSANGSTVVAGDAGETFEEHNPEYNGAAYVITKPAGGWSSGAALSDLLPTGLSGETNFGEKVAISADGATVAVLAPGQAAIYVFTAAGATWPATASPVAKLTSSDTAIDDNSGFSSLAISGDASTIVTGARPTGAAPDPDTVDLWARPTGGTWASSTIESAQLTSTSESANVGWSLAASQDGSVIAAGAPFTVVGTNNQQGAVELYDRPGAAWTSETQSQQLTATDGAASDNLGRGVGLSADGSTVVADAPNAVINGNREEGAAYVFNTADDVSIAAGDPVNEPATGSVSQSFTVSVPQPAAANIAVDFKTIDGTATSANNNYTPTTSGSVTIPEGSTSATIMVPVDDGNGTATTASLSYQVQLTSSNGPMISSSAGIATGVIKIPEVMGTVTDENGKPLAGAQIVMSGTASSGQTVLRQATSTITGTYTIYADPGSYDLGANPPSSSPGELTPAPCSDATVTTTEAGQTVEDCLLTLAAGDDQTVNFTQGKLLVTGITFQQLNAATEQLETVGQFGTIDGNRVQVTATIENVGDTDQTTDVQFGSPIDNSATVGTTVSNVAVPAGKSVQVDQILDTSGLAWDDSGQPDLERQIMITLTNGGSHLEQTLVVEPKPVVLVHGLFSNAAAWDAYIDGSGVTDVAGRVSAHKAGGGLQ
jgi:hypothetical protein